MAGFAAGGKGPGIKDLGRYSFGNRSAFSASGGSEVLPRRNVQYLCFLWVY